MSELDPRKEKFAQLIASGVGPKKAFLQAGFTAKNDLCVRVYATHLKKRMRPRITEIIVGCETTERERLKEITARVKATLGAFQEDIPWCREKLHELIEDKACPHSVRLGAIKECLNRGLGLPVQYVESNVNVRYQISDREMTEEEWFARYANAKPIN